MEDTKKIIYSILFLLILISCERQKKIDFYNTHFQKISQNDNIKKSKLNLYEYKRQLTISTDYITQYLGNNEQLMEKNNGIILQDSIYSLKTNSFYAINTVLNLSTYQEIEKNILYKDLNNVYYNTTSRNSNFPYIILDMKPEKAKILDGGYILDDRNIYSYGGITINKLDSVDIGNFRVIKFKNKTNNTPFYIGTDNKSLYKNESKLTLEDIKDLPILKIQKDSLSSFYKK